MRSLLKQTGSQQIPTVFLVSDNNILEEIFLEDINNILNNGEIPNLMQAEDLEEIYSEIKVIAKEMGIFESKENLNKIFIQKTRQNLHIVLNMSPVGDKLRNRSRSVIL